MRSLLDRTIDELAANEFGAALAGAGHEDERWEAKRDDVRPLHVVRVIAGLANRTGGLLLLGASRAADESWVLAGTQLLKLGLRDRMQAVVFADEHGILVPVEPD